VINHSSACFKVDSCHKVCTGAPVEMITPGGEAQFVAQMVRESVQERYGHASPEVGLSDILRRQGSEATDKDPLLKRRRKEYDQPPALASPISSLPRDHASVLERTVQRARSRWYTSMLGKLSSVTDVVEVIRGYKVSFRPRFFVLLPCSVTTKLPD
jgi:hypothetical protein